MGDEQIPDSCPCGSSRYLAVDGDVFCVDCANRLAVANSDGFRPPQTDEYELRGFLTIENLAYRDVSTMDVKDICEDARSEFTSQFAHS